MTFEDIDFLIIGAAKSATTTLHKALSADPEILLPPDILEIHYFSRHFDRGQDWYLSHFDRQPQHRLVGERSNSYMEEPRAAERIGAAMPHAHLVAQLRNPVERAYSDYCMYYRRGEVSRAIGNYLDPRGEAKGRFLTTGLYATQLSAFRDRFPRDQILVSLMEDARAAPKAELARIRGFLGLAGAGPEQPGDRMKDKSIPTVDPRLRRSLRALKPVVAPFRGSAPFRFLRGLVVATPSYPPLTRELRDRLVDYYAKDVDALGTLVGRDLSGWLEETPSAPRHASAAE
jgi:hypothetical protein